MKFFIALIFFLVLGSAAHAAVLADPQWQAWLDDDKPVELQHAASARLIAQPGDAQATAALAMAAIVAGDERGVDAAVGPLQDCVARLPQQALCHYVLGNVQALRAFRGGAFSILRLVGTVESELERAVALDPLFYEAREALARIYLAAPSALGGGTDKARQLADAAQAQQPAVAQLLRAMIFAHAKQWPEMERELDGIPLGKAKGFRADLADQWLKLGVSYMFGKQPDKARAVFERIEREQPTSAAGPFGMARLEVDQGRPAEAVKLYQQAAALEGTRFIPVDYRLGLAAITVGDKALARAALQRYVANRRAVPKYRDDAKKRLSELR